MSDAAWIDRLRQAATPLGDRVHTLVVGERSIRMSAELSERLRRRWGGFLDRATSGEPCATVRVLRGGAGFWLDAPRRGEDYRIEACGEPGDRLVASYHFALGADEAPGSWRMAVTDEADEPLERIVDNALRVVTARIAVEDGGFAVHGAGVSHDGRAWLFAGPSRAGKSTVVRMLAPATTLGDDFALVVPGPAGWCAPAVPFDNSERVDHVPPAGLLPLAGLWRLFQAEETRVEPPPRGRAVSSLMGCTAFPWVMPELGAALLEQVARFVAEARFGHLHFAKDAELWPYLGGAG
jgi:hypothetical protein